MKKNGLKKVLQSGETAFGPFLKLTDPAVVEIMGFAGFDFVIIDAEHGPISMQSAQNISTPLRVNVESVDMFVLRIILLWINLNILNLPMKKP